MAVPGRKSHFSVAYFNPIALPHSNFEALYSRTSIKGEAYIYALDKLMNTYHVYTARMSPVLNRSFVLERFERGSTIKICNGIMFFISTQDCYMYVHMHAFNCDIVAPS